MKYIEVSTTKNLHGSVKIQGSKNSTLALMAAACLSNGTVILDNTPNISDVHIFLNIIKNMGGKAGFIDTNRILINPEGISETIVESFYTHQVRPAYYFIGALLSKHKKIKIGYPGGDRIGKRPIDQHIKGFKLMGAKVELYDEFYVVSADRLSGCEISFDVISGGATLNIMMAAVLAKGTTTLYNAARDPEVVDTAILLNKMGARIHGAGTNEIRINGVENLSGCSHAAIPDRLIAGAYLMATGITGGCVTIENIIPEHVLPLAYKLREAGIESIINENSITTISDGRIKPIKVIAEKYPMLETDYQQPLSALLLNAKGSSTIIDKVYPERLRHCEQLLKMGANIEWSSGIINIKGGMPLQGTEVQASDIRAGTCLVLAALLAEGKTRITGIEHIERGFENIIRDLSVLGADIKLVSDESNNGGEISDVC